MKKFAQTAILIASVAVILVFLLAPQFYHTENLSFRSADVMDLSEGWNYENADGDLRPVLLPATIADASADALTITRVLPAALSQDSALCLRTSQQSLRAYIGDTLIYERGFNENRYFGNCIGSSWNIIPLPEDAAGQTLTLVLSSSYSRTANHINEVLYGTQTALLYQIAANYAPALIASVLFLLVGIILLASHFALHEIKFQNPILLYLGEFIILISFWFMGESKMLQFFFSDRIFITTLPFFALLLLPMPSALYMSAIHSKRWQKGFAFLFLVYFVNFLVCFVLVLLGKVGLYQTVFYTDLLLGIGLVYSLFATVSDVFHHSDTSSWLNVISAGILVVFGGAELLHFIQGDLLEVSDFLRLGILLIVAVNGLYYLHRIVRATEDERENPTTRKWLIPIYSPAD